MIYWQIVFGLIGVVQVIKNMTGVSGRILVPVFGALGIAMRALVLHEFDPWVALYTIAVAVLLYDFMVFPALEMFWHLFRKHAVKKSK